MQSISPSVLPTSHPFLIRLCKQMVGYVYGWFASNVGVSAVLFALILFSSVAGGQWTTPVPINPSATFQTNPLIAVIPQRLSLRQPDFEVDSLGGKYFVGAHVTESRIYFARKDVVSSTNDKGFLPRESKLLQNYPYPFNPSTIINYQLPVAGHVTLKVYDLLGREVMTLVDGIANAGRHDVTVDGSRLPSGVYFYILTAGSHRATKKMVLIK